MKIPSRSICFIVIFALFLCSHVFAQEQGTNTGVLEQDSEKIAKINVTGNERVDTGFIMNSIKTKESDPFNIEKLREDLKNIYKTGFFTDVQIDLQDSDKGKVVTFVVMERPPIKAVFVSGNKKIKTADITDKLKIRTNSVLNIEKIKESMDEIKKLYSNKGFYAAKISYEITYEEGYEVTIQFDIEEPEKSFVKKVEFTGNKRFKSRELRDYMRTKKKGILSWFTGSGILDEEVLEEDKKNLEAFYNDNGYVKVEVGIPDIKVSPDGKNITINISVEEGDLFSIGSVDFSGDVIFDREKTIKDLKSKSGKTFRSSLLHQDIMVLTDIYRDQGYAFCEIVPFTSLDEEEKKVNLSFDIRKGKEIFVNRINMLGNNKTRDKVIRRELRIAEGDRFSAEKLKLSKKRLRNTTFFKEEDIKIVKTEYPDKVNLDIAVEEKPTGSISLGVGYSSTDRLILSGNIAQENFFGTGRKFYLDAAISAFTQEYKLSYLEPYVFDLNLDLGLSVFNYGREMDTYDYLTTGGSGSLIKPLTEDIKASVRYRFESTKVSRIDDSASEYIKEQEGTLTTSSVTLGLAKNTIDDILNPFKGVNSDVSVEIAGGPFAGDNYFYRAIAFYGRYIPAGFWDSTFFLKGTAGVIRSYGGREVPVYEKFYVGGLNTVRGFKYGEAGPLDEREEVIGGKNQLYFNLEWVFPIYKPAGLKGVLFFDAGHAFDDTKGFMLNGIRTSAGMGIRWFSPMGPIRLELGFNLAPKDGERASVFDFAIGTQY